MVVNSNLNGFKTDGVIDEYIDHKATINQDGSVIAEIKIRRVHNGGERCLSGSIKLTATICGFMFPWEASF